MMLKIKLPPISKIIFQTALKVRISDINYGNHLGHDSLISLLHEARMRLIKSLGYSNELNIDGSGMLITNLAVNYKNEAFYSDTITIEIGVNDFTKTSLQLVYKIYIDKNNKEIAEALTTITFYDYKKSKVTKIPQSFLSSIGLNIRPPLL